MQVPEFICAKDLAARWGCSVRQAQQIIKDGPDRVKIGRRWYAQYDLLQRKPMGNPGFRDSKYQSRLAQRRQKNKNAELALQPPPDAL